MRRDTLILNLKKRNRRNAGEKHRSGSFVVSVSENVVVVVFMSVEAVHEKGDVGRGSGGLL